MIFKFKGNSLSVRVTKPLPAGRQAFRLLVKVTCKELRDDKRSLLLTIRASLPLPVDGIFIITIAFLSCQRIYKESGVFFLELLYNYLVFL